MVLIAGLELQTYLNLQNISTQFIYFQKSPSIYNRVAIFSETKKGEKLDKMAGVGSSPALAGGGGRYSIYVVFD